MTVTISPETQKLLEEKLKTGAYSSADELLHAALEALGTEAELDRETLEAIDRAEEAVDAGRVHEWKDVREVVKAKLLGK